MSQTIRQRQALNGARRHLPMAVDVSQPRRVHCQRDLKPGRGEPAVLRLRPSSQEDLDENPGPGPLPAALFIMAAVLIALGLYAWLA
ncbi:hypothetical protein C3942_00720 [Solimonas fluminis]|uniref:Uncharacterized protein n=1 Tax=Solimonas fluminis TaxID=2086571 RepID=A0A2S5TKG2_9GAMM|nr:hypothetical protein [Solimonas fluminis]PPE75451.1 hypothetical protein C3942_00720 [Solimonas fluminis]